ncbi:MAG: type II toxin-antitoxin system prevent-host-death family antitoxin [Candidatus Competibacteraceae bacterium]|nr:type II toxin-antitoxin system prevent-host-death family antitoxin [Candidatus Competibacteraceae bacterium]
MASIGIYGAKTHLPELLERVARGERITITRGGQPMAVLGPADPPRPREVATTLAALADFRHRHPLSTEQLTELLQWED